MKLDIRSLKFHLWLYFILFAVIILLVLWCLQILFLNAYYQLMKTNEITGAAAKISAQYGTENFQSNAQQLAFENNLVVLLIDDQGDVLMSADMTGNTSPRKQPREIFEPLQEKLLENPEQSAVLTMDNPMFHNRMLVYGKLLTNNSGERELLFISSYLDPIGSTTNILKDQLIYISVILLVLAFALSFFLSRRISKPITKLTGGADRLAKGDYSVDFERSYYSEIDQLSRTLNYATKQISKVDELRKDLIANVSHDLRTPLTMIKAYAEMIRDLSGEKPKKRREHLDVIIGEADRLSILVNDILDLSEIQSGVEMLNITHIDISMMTKSILKRYSILSEKDGYTFENNLPERASAQGDEHRIEQVIYNLINNAINYTGDDRKVFITVTDLPDMVRFEVRDTGSGIAKDELENIWERYYKVDGAHKRTVVGTGLGLAIVKNILEQHGAAFGVESSVGQGSTFWFELKK
ncbi:MAG: HAMP domain-containing sensor histidine kinase [Bacillota bacterium]|nr:HAMP domain-containing sensor histidine kinase [Bacillota bacterium]